MSYVSDTSSDSKGKLSPSHKASHFALTPLVRVPIIRSQSSIPAFLNLLEHQIFLTTQENVYRNTTTGSDFDSGMMPRSSLISFMSLPISANLTAIGAMPLNMSSPTAMGTPPWHPHAVTRIRGLEAVLSSSITWTLCCVLLGVGRLRSVRTGHLGLS